MIIFLCLKMGEIDENSSELLWVWRRPLQQIIITILMIALSYINEVVYCFLGSKFISKLKKDKPKMVNAPEGFNQFFFLICLMAENEFF